MNSFSFLRLSMNLLSPEGLSTRKYVEMNWFLDWLQGDMTPSLTSFWIHSWTNFDSSGENRGSPGAIIWIGFLEKGMRYPCTVCKIRGSDVTVFQADKKYFNLPAMMLTFIDGSGGCSGVTTSGEISALLSSCGSSSGNSSDNSGEGPSSLNFQHWLGLWMHRYFVLSQKTDKEAFLLFSWRFLLKIFPQLGLTWASLQSLLQTERNQLGSGLR